MKIFTGQVVSNKMQKTTTVVVSRVVVHPVYKKRFTQTKKYQVHDELGTKVNQKVKFVACKPFSKTKKWKIIEIVGPKSENNVSKVEVLKTVKKIEKKGK